MISRLVARNFLSLLLSNVVGQLLVLWAFVHIAKVFGPDGFGKFSFAQVIGLHFLYLADFGLQTLGTRMIAQQRHDVPRLVWNISVLRIVLAVGNFAVLVLCSIFLTTGGESQALIIIFGLVLLPSAVLFEWVFLGLEQMEIVGLGRILKGAIFAGLVFCFVHSPDRLTFAAAFYLIGIIVAAGVLVAMYFTRFPFRAEKIEYRRFGTTLSTAVPLAVGSLLIQINFNFGTLALGVFLPDDIVGQFAAAHKIVLFLLAFVVVAAANSVFPLMARSFTNSTAEFSNSLKGFLRLFIIVALPVGVGGSVLASQIMDYLYPSEFQDAVVVFQISIWIVVIAIYRVIFENALIASRSQRSYLFGHVFAGALTVLGNVLLVPVLGIIAPSIVGILAEFALLVFFLISCKYVRSSYMIRTTIKPLLAALLMGGTLFLPLNLFALLGIGIVSYFGSLLFLRGLTFHEVAGWMQSLTHRSVPS